MFWCTWEGHIPCCCWVGCSTCVCEICWFWVLSTFLSSLILFLVVLSIIESQGLKCPTSLIELSFPFSSGRFCFMYLGLYIRFPRWLSGKESACNAGDMGSIPGSGRLLEEGMATHSSTLAWRILWTEEPGGLQFMRLQRARHDGATKQHQLLTCLWSSLWMDPSVIIKCLSLPLGTFCLFTSFIWY